MDSPSQLLVFHLDDQRYGLLLGVVERAVRIVEITPLPKAPGIVLGVVNVQGRVVPVVNLRARFRLPERGIALSDQLVIARTKKRTIALAVDSVAGVFDFPEGEAVSAENIVPGTDYIAGVVKLADGLVLIQDLDRFLSLDEERTLSEAEHDA